MYKPNSPISQRYQHSTAPTCCPPWGWCSAPLLPPLGEVPRSGKGGGVGIFELFPFIEQHPLSQPCRFRSAVKSASSPIGEPSGLLRIRLGYHEAIGACRETPLRLAKSRLTAVARLHGACGRTSQPLRAASSPIGEPRDVLSFAGQQKGAASREAAPFKITCFPFPSGRPCG